MKQHWATALVTEKFSLSHFSAFFSQEPENTSILPICSHSLSFSICTYPTCWMVQILLRQKSLSCDAKQSLITRSLGGCATVLQCKKSASATSAAASVLRSRPIQLFAIYGSSRVAALFGQPNFHFHALQHQKSQIQPLRPLELKEESEITGMVMWLAPKMPKNITSGFSLIALLFHCET